MKCNGYISLQVLSLLQENKYKNSIQIKLKKDWYSIFPKVFEDHADEEVQALLDKLQSLSDDKEWLWNEKLAYTYSLYKAQALGISKIDAEEIERRIILLGLKQNDKLEKSVLKVLLEMAIQDNNIAVIENLCKREEEAINSLYSKDKHEFTVLHRAIYESINNNNIAAIRANTIRANTSISIVKLLLQAGVNINTLDKGSENTVLHLVFTLADSSNEEMFKLVKILTRYGADPNIKNNENKSVIDLAIEAENFECIRYWLEHGKIQLVSSDGKNTPAANALLGCKKFISDNDNQTLFGKQKKIQEIMMNKDSVFSQLNLSSFWGGKQTETAVTKPEQKGSLNALLDAIINLVQKYICSAWFAEKTMAEELYKDLSGLKNKERETSIDSIKSVVKQTKYDKFFVNKDSILGAILRQICKQIEDYEELQKDKKPVEDKQADKRKSPGQ